MPELGVVAYAGIPLRAADGQTLGAFCAIDTVPHEWTSEQIGVLQDLAAAAMAEIELRTTITALQRSESKLREQATRDPLTGLFNRRGFSDLAREMLRVAQLRDRPLSVVALDLDGFKRINDTLGHDAGDEALVEMTSVLTGIVREQDLVARLGGDEFIIVLDGCDRRAAEGFLRRLYERLGAWQLEAPREYALRTSAGIGCWTPGEPVSLVELLRQADTAMYRHKTAQRERAA